MYKSILSFILLFQITVFASINQINTNLSQKEFKTQSSKQLKSLLKKNISLVLDSKKTMKRYYRYHNYKTFWIDQNGFKPILSVLINQIQNDHVMKRHLNKAFNFSKVIEKKDSLDTLSRDNLEDFVRVDMIFTSIYNKYLGYLSKGFIDWDKFEEELAKLEEEHQIMSGWEKYGISKNVRKLLYKAIKENDLSIAFDAVTTTYPKSDLLTSEIAKHEKILEDGDFIKIPKTTTLKKDVTSPIIEILRNRLIQSKDLEVNNCLDCLSYFDDELESAVKNFQRNHGLKVDGVVGRNTIRILNLSAKEKIKIMSINLERMRWLPRKMGTKHILVNIPDYKLEMIEDKEVKLDMKIVVGKRSHPTPIFSNKISFLVLNPYWRIPERIVKREIVPKLIKNPKYLDGRGIRMHENWEEDSNHFDIKTIDWKYYLENENEEENFDIPLKFIQIPSNKNPLGRIKFMFPNKYSVYLHDSPARRYFKYRKRAYSHGCIRLEKPRKLLETISQIDKNINFEEATATLSDIKKEKVLLDKKLPVHIIYLTSWVNKDNQIQFREDIYGYDKLQNNIITKRKTY